MLRHPASAPPWSSSRTELGGGQGRGEEGREALRVGPPPRHRSSRTFSRHRRASRTSIEGETMKWEQRQPAPRRRAHAVIMEHKGDLHPQIIIRGQGRREALAQLGGAREAPYIQVKEGQKIKAGDRARQAARARGPAAPRTSPAACPASPSCSKRAGPRRTPSVISEIDGIVELGDKKRGKRTIILRVLGEKGEETGKEMPRTLVPHGKYLRVHKGDRGPRRRSRWWRGRSCPTTSCASRGRRTLHAYLLNEVQNVYRSQGVTIDDKHIEIIIGPDAPQDPGGPSPGDSGLPPRYRRRQVTASACENKRMRTEAQGKPATGMSPCSSASPRRRCQSESFISAASPSRRRPRCSPRRPSPASATTWWG